MKSNQETIIVRKIARAFARAIGRDWGADALRDIDRLNELETSPGVCHSHDGCDANVYMDEAFKEVTGISPAELLPNIPDEINARWEAAWKYAFYAGFARLGAPRGIPDNPPELMEVETRGDTFVVTLPGAPPLTDFPLDVELDYWGRTPHLQVLCRNHNDREGEPAVCVRYDRDGRVVEVAINKPDVLVVSDYSQGLLDRAKDSPWVIERAANPTCLEGDLLRCPSGHHGEVMRLRDRYASLEEFRAWAESYDVLARLSSNPASPSRIYETVEQAWEVNPLTVATLEPDDFSTVPEPSDPPTP